MANAQTVEAESSHLPNLEVAHESPASCQPGRRDSYSSNGTGPYLPLPPGRWTLDFHGNCPRCHHHHRAVEVKVKVSQDPSHVSHVYCEECHESWAAFGGRNTTRISLLSTTTTEPDPIEREVRYRFIDVVKAAMAAASLEPLVEQASHTSPTHSSDQAPLNQETRASTSLQMPSASATPAEHAPPVEPSLPTQHQERIAHPGKKRSRPRQVLSEFKGRVTTRFPMLHRENLLRKLGVSRPPAIFVKYFEKSSVYTPPAEDLHIIEGTRAHIEPDVSDVNANEPSPSGRLPIVEATAHSPSRRLVEVASFLGRLDQSALKSMSEQERDAWMRENYTAFKARNRELRAPLSLSTIVHTSIRPDSPHFHLRSPNRDSAEVFGTWGGRDDMYWRGSDDGRISISDRVSEANTACDELTIASYPRYERHQPHITGGQRPHSFSSAPRSLQNLRLFRSGTHHSVESLLQRRRASISSTVRGRPSVRWSGSSMGRSSLPDVSQPSTARNSLRHPLTQEAFRYDE